MKICFSQQIFEKSSNIKCNESPSSRNRVVPCGQTDGRTDMIKLIVKMQDEFTVLRLIIVPSRAWKCLNICEQLS